MLAVTLSVLFQAAAGAPAAAPPPEGAAVSAPALEVAPAEQAAPVAAVIVAPVEAAAPVKEAKEAKEEKIICRTEFVTGSRARKQKVCVTASEYEARVTQTQKDHKNMLDRSGNSGPPAIMGGG